MDNLFFLVPFAGLFSMADSWVWGHFTKPAKKGDKATCAIVGSNGKLCGAQIAYTSSTSAAHTHTHQAQQKSTGMYAFF
jgi:hypothetical protein